MNDLEEALRAGMRDATDSVFGDLDLDSVVASGERVLRGRVIRRSLGAAAAVVAAGLMAYAGLANRPIPGVPAPVATLGPSPSPVETSTPNQPSAHGAVLVVDMAKEPFGAGLGLTSVTITLSPDPSSSANITAVASGGKTTSRNGIVSPGAPFLAKLSTHVWVMVTPDEVQWAEAAVEGGVAYASNAQLDGRGVIIAMAEPGKLAPKLTGFIWQDAEGKVWSDRGVRAPSATFTLQGRRYWFAHDPDLKVACSGEIRPGRPNTTDECGVITSDLVESGRGGSDGSGWEERSFLVLPAGAGEPTIDPNPRCSIATTPLDPGGQVSVLLVCSGNGEQEGLNWVIRYRDAHGGPVVYSP